MPSDTIELTFVNTIILIGVLVLSFYGTYLQDRRSLYHDHQYLYRNDAREQRRLKFNSAYNPREPLSALNYCISELSDNIEWIVDELAHRRFFHSKSLGRPRHDLCKAHHSRHNCWVSPSQANTGSVASYPDPSPRPPWAPRSPLEMGMPRGRSPQVAMRKRDNYESKRPVNDREARDGVAEAGPSSEGHHDRATSWHEAIFPPELVAGSHPQGRYDGPDWERRDQQQNRNLDREYEYQQNRPRTPPADYHDSADRR